MNVLGLMSGSSLDGLDMALCHFTGEPPERMGFELRQTRQVDFPIVLGERLRGGVNLSGRELMQLEAEFSYFLGNACRSFLLETGSPVDLIASHGHTVFHYPELGFTTQIGNGGIISQLAQCDVICDFRSSDIAAGGLGAPCAPIADFYLFPEVDLFINIGGISNISYRKGRDIKAFDISPANQLLNYLAALKGESYDKDGVIAASGEINNDLLELLIRSNKLEFAIPRALDNSWIAECFVPQLSGYAIEDAMRTVVEFINLEIIKAIHLLDPDDSSKDLLVTGGGAFNKFLINNLENKLKRLNVSVVNAEDEIINYKEAVLIGLMGYLRLRRAFNSLKVVTGASRNTVGGCIYAYEKQ